MKKFSILLTAIAMISSTALQADMPSKNMPAAPKQMANDDFNWGIALGALAVLGTVVGLTAASAASSPTSYSNVSE